MQVEVDSYSSAVRAKVAKKDFGKTWVYNVPTFHTLRGATFYAYPGTKAARATGVPARRKRVYGPPRPHGHADGVGSEIRRCRSLSLLSIASVCSVSPGTHRTGSAYESGGHVQGNDLAHQP